MKKRILTLLLVLTMVLSMVSCGKKEDSNKEQTKPTVAGLFDKVDGMDAKTVDLTVEADLSGIKENTTGLKKVGLKIASVVEDNENLKSSAEISYRLGDATEYTPLTTIIADNKTAYFDFAALKNAATQIATQINQSQYAAVIAMLPQASYVKIDEATMKEYFTSLTGEDASQLTKNSNTKVLEKVVRTVVEYIVTTMQDATKDVNPSVLTVEENGIKISVTKDNLGATCDAVSALDLNAKYDEVLNKVKEVQGSEEYVTAITKNKDSVVKGITDSIKETKNELENFKSYNLTGDIQVTGEQGKRQLTEKISMQAEDNKDRVEFTVAATCGEEVSSDKKVTVPTESTDFKEVMQQIMSMFNMGQ